LGESVHTGPDEHTGPDTVQEIQTNFKV